MRLKQVLSQVQQQTQLSQSQNLVLDFFIRGDENLSTLEFMVYLRRAKEAIRKLFRDTYSGIEGFVKSYVIPHLELVKFIIDTLPAVIKVLMIILPLILQRRYKYAT